MMQKPPNIAIIHHKNGKIQKFEVCESDMFPERTDYCFITDRRHDDGGRITIGYSYMGKKDNEGYHFYKQSEC